LDYTKTHKVIVDGCLRGDRQAQFELYRLYSKAMYNVCLRMVNNTEDAEDLLQNSFIDVFSKMDSFRAEASIGAWIKRIVINNCINYLKKKRLKVEELIENYHDAVIPIEECDDPNLTVPMVREALKELPTGYRVVFSLYAFEGYDHEEIGNILEISTSTSKSQYSRAKQKLRDHLQTSINKSY